MNSQKVVKFPVGLLANFRKTCSVTQKQRYSDPENVRTYRRNFARRFATPPLPPPLHHRSAGYVDVRIGRSRVKSYKIDGPDGDPLAPLTFYSHL